MHLNQCITVYFCSRQGRNVVLAVGTRERSEVYAIAEKRVNVPLSED